MLDLDALNSATKYPSIETYHALGERGSLTEEVTVFTGEVILTEKIDGTSSRIIRMPDGDWFIGSREELLTARGDRVHNPALGIVDALRALADRLTGEPTDQVTVYYLETYGAKIGAGAKQYTGTGAVGCRLFDMALLPRDILDRDPRQLAAWREAGGQVFASEPVLQRTAETQGVALTPRLAVLAADGLPASVDATHAWLGQHAPRTLAGLDEQAGGQAEGIVLRTADRALIAKARFQDYERTLKRRGRAGN